MIDAEVIVRVLRDAGMARWAAVAPAQLRQTLVEAPHGDWPRWRETIEGLPNLGPGGVSVAEGAVWLRPDQPLSAIETERLRASLMALHPWRKGPFRIGDLLVDSEWRSDWKWSRVEPHLEALDGRTVLDVGCGNGYHAWRAGLNGARLVVGIDPTALFLAQYLAVRRLMLPLSAELVDRVHLLPLGIEELPSDLRCFDTVFSMGVLYHRRSPIDHLYELRGALHSGGQLVLETLVIDGTRHEVLVPPGRYAKMRNVWFIPTTALLETWLRRVGFTAVRTVDVTVTRTTEQRATPWMTFESLADFLDPADSDITREHHPAPRRAVLVATAV